MKQGDGKYKHHKKKIPSKGIYKLESNLSVSNYDSNSLNPQLQRKLKLLTYN